MTDMPRQSRNYSADLESWLTWRFKLTLEDAQDVAQEARITVFAKSTTVSASSCTPLLRAVAIRVALNHVRKEKRFQDLMARTSLLVCPSTDEQFAEIDARSLLQSLCLKATLSEADAALLFGAVIGRLSLSQLAAQAGASECAVRKRIARAVRRIRKANVEAVVPE